MAVDEFTSIADAAEIYCSLGLLPIPLYGIQPDGRCTCGNANCKAPGKHPVGAGWQKAATSDLDVVRDRFRAHHGNIGVYLGNKFVLIDADGDAGLDDIDKLGELPPTLMALSGSRKGGHWIFKLQPHQSAERITDRRLPGLSVDIKVRGQFVAAPSMHSSGNRYEWIKLCEPAPLPDHLYALICTPERVKSEATPSTPSPTAERVRAWVAKADPAVSGQGGHDATFRVACKIAAQGLTEDEEFEILSEYNERCDPPWSDAELTHKLREARKKTTSTPLGPLRVVPQDETPANDTSWMIRCIFENTKSGASRLARVGENAVLILQNDHRWAGRIRLDEFAQDISVTNPPWHDHHTPAARKRHWTDGDTSRLQSWLIREHGLNLSVADLERAVYMVAEHDAHNSAEDWMDGLLWDGYPRLDRWLASYLGTEDTAYTRAVGKWWVISAVARVYKPGCKADCMLILYGDQGKGKSSAAGILAGQDWFADSALDITNKDAYLALRGKLIVEMAELEGLNRAESNAIKSFLSSRIDNYRPPYARRAVDVPRRCVFIGTTNNEEMLKDDTGDRRFWPVVCGDIDREMLAKDRDQIWAEAIVMFRQGAAWYPETKEEQQMVEKAQAGHKQTHPWQPIIANWVERSGTTCTTVQQVLKEAIGLQVGQWKDAESKAVAGCLKRLGWEARNDTKYDGSKRRYYVFSGQVDSRLAG